jgi:hypothetical protein
VEKCSCRQSVPSKWRNVTLGINGFLDIVRHSKKHSVPEIGSVSVLRWEVKTHTLLSLLEEASPNHWTTYQSHSHSYVTTDGQSASLSWCQAPIWGPRPNFYYCQTTACWLMWGILSDDRACLSFIIFSGPRQRGHCRVRVPRDSWPYFTLWDSRFPKPGEPGPRIYILQEEGGPVMPPGTGFPFRRLLHLAGLRWRYSNPPPHGQPISA